jgi:hypothetical protein
MEVIDPEHDVVAKCPNGKLKRNTAPIYVVIRVDVDGADTDADVIAYSYDADFGSKFIEQIACRETYGKFWDYKKDGSPCFDPYTDDGEERPFPDGRFMMWDETTLEDETDEAGMPMPATPTLVIFDGPDHHAIRKYKLSLAQLTINDYMSIETEGDRFFTKNR